MRRWLGIPLALLVLAGLAPATAWANSEMHPGGRLFYPLWDVSTPNRLTFIIVTREARRDDSSISSAPTGTIIGGVATIITRFRVSGTPGNCLPRGAGGSSSNINRSDLGGTAAAPVFVDDLHFEYYGKSCVSTDETIHMSCADIDLFLLASPDNASGIRPRFAFDGVAQEGRGALDVHLVNNGQSDPRFRKSAEIGDDDRDSTKGGGDESLLGHAIISDISEGWAATYPAAAARTTSCGPCAKLDGGTKIGYEPYPMEVFLPFALADPFTLVPSAPGAPLRNVLSLWGPSLNPGGNLSNTSISLDFKWWDGRERFFTGSVIAHSLIRPLGGNAIGGLDPPLDSIRFNSANFVCGHTAVAGKAENDGFPRAGTSATACGAPDVADTAHPSDNFEATPDITNSGHQIQSSTAIGWWRFLLRRDGQIPSTLNNYISGRIDEGIARDHSGRGLVGVVLSSTPGSVGNGVGDATRLWHKASCEISQSGLAWGPPHKYISEDQDMDLGSDNILPYFNVFTFLEQGERCNGEDFDE